ncbi:MAG: PulJ/GspJ family protein [Thermoanaerobaculia bacterium]
MSRDSQRGFSLMEITVVLAIVSFVMILVYSLIEETMQVTMFNESHNELAILSQSAVNTLQFEVQQAKVAFEEDSLGAAYRSAMILPAGVTVWKDSLLPVFDTSVDAQIGPDPKTQRYTGNSLLIARQLPPASITYKNVAGSTVEFLADIYQFEYFYLAQSKTKSFSGSGMTMDLLMSQSERYADEFQLTSLADGEAALIVQTMLKDKKLNVTHAWTPGAPLASAFYPLADATDGEFDKAVKNPKIATGRTTTLLRPFFGVSNPLEDQPGDLPEFRLDGGVGISGGILYSVGFGSFPLPVPMRQFAQPQPLSPGFPAGFEVKVAGPARNRKVMTRVVLMSHYGAKKTYEAQQGFVVTAARF